MMQHAEILPAYRILDPASVLALLGDLGEVRARLGPRPEDWNVREVGDGNLNLVFIVEGPEGSVCVKQALPYVRAAGPSWPMSLDRAFFENSYYVAVAPYVGKLIPTIYHYDSSTLLHDHGAPIAPYHPAPRVDCRTPVPASCARYGRVCRPRLLLHVRSCWTIRG